MASFATPQDLATYLGQDVSIARAEELLSAASADIRLAVGEPLTGGSFTARLPYARRLLIPSRFVSEVTAVTVDGDAVGYKAIGLELYLAPLWSSCSWLPLEALVAYDSVVPADVLAAAREACEQLAALAYVNPDGKRSESIDDYSVTFDTGSVAGRASASARDRILDRLERVLGTFRVEL